MKLLVVDGNSIANRAFYGIKVLTTKTGRYTNAIVGFMNILLKLRAEHAPDEIAVAFDLKTPTFRHKMFDGYKAQRKGMPDELAAQMPVLKELLADLGYRQVTCEGFEADDILGTLAAACASRGDDCLLATGDRDSLQLVGPRVTVLLAGTGATVVMDEAAVREKYGLAPRQLIDVKSLMGDASDNIPGVAGVGEKTALALIQSFGSLAGVYEHIGDAAIKNGVREKLLRDKAQAEMSRTLAEIVCDAPVESARGEYAPGAPDAAAARALLQSLEMYAVLKKLDLPAAGAAAAPGAANAAGTAGADARPAVPGVEILPLDGPLEGACWLCFAGTDAGAAGTGRTDAAAGTGRADGAGAAGMPGAPGGEPAQLAFGELETEEPADEEKIGGENAGEAAGGEAAGAGKDGAAQAAVGGDDSAGAAASAAAGTSASAAAGVLPSAVILAVQGEHVYAAAPDSAALLDLLENDNCEKYFFDAKPFHRLALAHGRHVRAAAFDAKLAAYLLNPAASEYPLLRLAQDYGVQPAFTCARPEAAVLAPLCAELRAQVDAAGMGKLLDDIELPLCEVLADMEHTGILADRAGIAAFGRELQAALTQELAAVYDIVGYEFNVNSPKQLGKALFEDLGLPARRKTKSGYSTNAETLESLRDQSPAIGHILLYRTYQKLNSTYVEGLLKVIAPDGRIHSTFYQTETRTGRISSAEPNLQNIPVRTELGSRFRKYFLAPAGSTLLDADYSQIELRILAHIADDTTMQQAFRDGADIHRSTAAKIYGLEPEQVTPRLRSSAKAVNFGIVYGIGAFSLAKDIGTSVKEAEEFIRTYFANFPNVKKYMDETVAKAHENGYVTTLYGRRRLLPELANTNRNIRALGERMAMNTPIQGTAADIIKLAMVRVYRRLAAEGLRAKLILQVHDELIVECPADERERAAKILGEEMRGAAQLAVPLAADVNAGQTWYDAKG